LTECQNQLGNAINGILEIIKFDFPFRFCPTFCRQSAVPSCHSNLTLLAQPSQSMEKIVLTFPIIK
uniref:Ovule protein n=1 Tax=Rodentolepis nana TaxID=102285 RepID=A0A0R3T5N6_RODNA